MTYKETLQFIGKCLTLGVQPERIDEVRQEIRNGNVIWEQIVQISSGQFVLPALFIRLKNASLLGELPPDLVEYMEYLTNCNRDRNLQILDQMKDISLLMNDHEISPVFLKGTAHLLLPLYDDIAERMIGDIDFLVEEKDFMKAVQLLIDTGYCPLAQYNNNAISITKHYPRLQNFNYPAAVEVHRVVIAPPKDGYLVSIHINRDKQRIDGAGEVYIPSVHHLIVHNVLNVQINDKAYLKGDIYLRQMYDMLLLSANMNSYEVLMDETQFKNLSNTYLASISLFFNQPANIKFDNTWQVLFFIKRLRLFIKFPKYLPRFYKTIIYLFMRFSRYFVLPIQSIFNREVRSSLWFRISDPKWYKNHFLSYWKYLITK